MSGSTTAVTSSTRIAVPVGFHQRRTATMLLVLTMVTGYSRWASAVLIPTRRGEDLFHRLVAADHTLGAVPRGAASGRGGQDRTVAR